MKENLLTIVNRYGIKHQRNKLAEEYRELQDEIYKFEKGEEAEDILGELVDVMVVSFQFLALAGYSFDHLEENIKKKLNFKINRQIKRIENE